MNVGMLWYDDDAEPALPVRIRRAADYYRSKYGVEADLCMVNPSLREAGLPRHVGSLEVRTHQSVLKHHFWLGVRAES